MRMSEFYKTDYKVNTIFFESSNIIKEGDDKMKTYYFASNVVTNL